MAVVKEEAVELKEEVVRAPIPHANPTVVHRMSHLYPAVVGSCTH